MLLFDKFLRTVFFAKSTDFEYIQQKCDYSELHLILTLPLLLVLPVIAY